MQCLIERNYTVTIAEIYLIDRFLDTFSKRTYWAFQVPLMNFMYPPNMTTPNILGPS